MLFFVDNTSQQFVLVLLEDLPVEQFLHFWVEFVFDEGLGGGVRVDYGWIFIGVVDLGFLRGDSSIVISQVNDD